MKKSAFSLFLALVMMLCAAGATAEELTGESFVGNWAATQESMITVLEIPEGSGATVTLAISLVDEFYDLVLDWTESATEKVTWQLNGSYDPDAEALYGYGMKTRYTLNEAGDVISAEIENEEVNAEFTFTEAGLINWRDSDEGIDGVLFEKAPAEAAE